MSNDAWLFLGAIVGAGVPLLMYWAWLRFAYAVFPNESLLVLRFGKLAQRIDAPGLAIVWDAWAPWAEVRRVSRRIQSALIHDLEVHDIGGSEARTDVFVEYRVVDPVRATFAIQDLHRAVENVVSHTALGVLGTQPLSALIRDDGELGDLIRAECTAETSAWGVEVLDVLFRQIRPSSIATEQLLGEVAARLEKTKARIEEEGRQAVALLHARTAADTATLVGRARGQYSLGVGRAYREMRSNPAVHAAYRELNDLVLLRPQRTVTFRGFDKHEVRAVDAAMFEGVGAGPTATS
ncbi:MAG: SPFH domain-containing protein [Myxococcota bacterium]